MFVLDWLPGEPRGASTSAPYDPLVEEIALVLGVPTVEDASLPPPDYKGLEAEIQVPTHQPYDMDILERIKERYEAILKGLAEG